MKRLLLYLIHYPVNLAILLICFNSLKAQPYPYLSPGIQIGYNFTQGFFYSVQLTFGLIEPGHGTGLADVQPGITIGLRKYKHQVMVFTDFQIAIIVNGFGIGYVWIKPSEKSNHRTLSLRGIRGKLWGGLGINVTYDFHKIHGHKFSHNLGLIGVYPIVFDSGKVYLFDKWLEIRFQ